MALTDDQCYAVDLCGRVLSAASAGDNYNLMTMLDILAATIISAVSDDMGRDSDDVAAQHANHIMMVIDHAAKE